MQLAKMRTSQIVLGIVTLKAPIQTIVMFIYELPLRCLSNPYIVCLEVDDGEHYSICLKPMASLWLVGKLVHAVPVLSKPLSQFNNCFL